MLIMLLVNLNHHPIKKLDRGSCTTISELPQPCKTSVVDDTTTTVIPRYMYLPIIVQVLHHYYAQKIGKVKGTMCTGNTTR